MSQTALLDLEESPTHSRPATVVGITEEINAEQLKIVLAWVKTEVEGSDLIARVPGVTHLQSAFLGRLSALIIGNLSPSTAPQKLLDALAPAREIEVPEGVKIAFKQLLMVDPIVSLAHLYSATISASNRRALGTFFTPRNAATTMVREYACLHKSPSRVIDIGAGVGVFSEAAQSQWAATNVDAIDINPVTLGLQAAALQAIGRESVSLFLEDFAEWIKDFTPEGSTLYLGNPPYTRWQLIPAEDRARLLELSGGLVEARANLSTIFLAIVLGRLRPQDSLSLIVPASWMEARYARKLRAFVREQRLRSVTLRFADSWRFEKAIVDAVVVEIGPEASTPQGLVITDWPGSITLEQAREAADTTPFPRLLDVSHRQARSTPRTTGCLGDIAKFSRGVATGANGFFVLSQEEAIAHGVDQRWLTSIARRLRGGPDISEPTVERALLLTLGAYQSGEDPKLDLLIAEGERLGINRGHLCAQRRRWFDLAGEIKHPDVILTSLGRERFHFYENLDGLAITNNLFGITWQDGVDATQKAYVLSWLRSEEGQDALISSSTTEANGLHRLSPRSLKLIRIPLGNEDSADSSLELTEGSVR